MTNEMYLRVFENKSELVVNNGETEVFLEGKSSQNARERARKIIIELSNGYLEKQIIYCRDRPYLPESSQLKSTQIEMLNKLVNSITSEVGRALVGLAILQLCVKAIAPQQSIRLHKSSANPNAFSWEEGISMRSLDKQYVTPVLRKYNLLKLNAYGFMMTRSLAENYPYSPVYKANIRGARLEWLNLVEAIEAEEINPEIALHYLLSQLLNKVDAFEKLAAETIGSVKDFLDSTEEINRQSIEALIWKHINESDYAARIMEIAMDALMQALQEARLFLEGELKPLSQMRTANKKQGNIGDIEVLMEGNIIEAWDAKYGKPYLRDELEELADKLLANHEVLLVGFVTSVEPERQEELTFRCQEIEDEFGVSVEILTFFEWVKKQFRRVRETGFVTEEELASSWLIAYTESLAQKRRNLAPIDEPCQQWLADLQKIASNK